MKIINCSVHYIYWFSNLNSQNYLLSAHILHTLSSDLITSNSLLSTLNNNIYLFTANYLLTLWSKETESYFIHLPSNYYSHCWVQLPSNYLNGSAFITFAAANSWDLREKLHVEWNKLFTHDYQTCSSQQSEVHTWDQVKDCGNRITILINSWRRTKKVNKQLPFF